jgi:hypothetical protein
VHQGVCTKVCAPRCVHQGVRAKVCAPGCARWARHVGHRLGSSTRPVGSPCGSLPRRVVVLFRFGPPVAPRGGQNPDLVVNKNPALWGWFWGRVWVLDPFWGGVGFDPGAHWERGGSAKMGPRCGILIDEINDGQYT